MQTRSDLPARVWERFRAKRQSSAHRQLTDDEGMDPDDIQWLMRSQRKQSIPPLHRGIDTGSCCFGEPLGQAWRLPTRCPEPHRAGSRGCRLALWQPRSVTQQLPSATTFHGSSPRSSSPRGWWENRCSPFTRSAPLKHTQAIGSAWKATGNCSVSKYCQKTRAGLRQDSGNNWKSLCLTCLSLLNTFCSAQREEVCHITQHCPCCLTSRAAHSLFLYRF